MIILEKVGSEAQKERWLQPIIDGKVRSSFVMTEPHPGAGSDPLGMMRTRAERRGNKWVVHGHKWFITGADGAEHFILIARTSDDPRKGFSAFLFHKDQPGWSSSAASASWARRSTAAIASLSSTGSRFPRRTCSWGSATA